MGYVNRKSYSSCIQLMRVDLEMTSLRIRMGLFIVVFE